MHIVADLDTTLNASCYPGADSALKSYRLEALKRICGHSRSQKGGSVPGNGTVAAEREFSLQNKIQTTKRSHLFEAKTQNLMTVTSAAISLDAFGYA